MSICKKQEFNVEKCFSTTAACAGSGLLTLPISGGDSAIIFGACTNNTSVVQFSGASLPTGIALGVECLSGCSFTFNTVTAITGTVSIPCPRTNGTIFSLSGLTITGNLISSCLPNGGIVGAVLNLAGTGTVTAAGSGTLNSDATASIFITIPNPIRSIIPIAAFLCGANPQLSIIRLTNCGGVNLAIYALNAGSTATFPTTLPTVSTVLGTNGLVAIIVPGGSVTLTIQNLALLYAVPFETVGATSASPICLQVKLNLKFCVNSCEDDCDSGECKTEPVFVDTCSAAQGSCESGTAPPDQVLFSSLSLPANFFLAEIANLGTCDATISLMCAADNILTPVFPALSLTSGATLTAGQTFILGGNSVTELTSSCLASSMTAITSSVCNVTAAIKAFYCVQSCVSKGISPMIITGFGSNCKKSKKSKKHGHEKSRIIDFK